MLSKTCSFETRRLAVKEWHSAGLDGLGDLSLAEVVANMLTEPVTKSLPEGWQGAYTVERSVKWIEERDSEGATLLLTDRSSGLAVGLVFLFEGEQEFSGDIELRLGYLLAERAWGQGFASELVEGLVRWSREAGVATIVGGVARDNVASQRVLEKNGFVCDSSTEGDADHIFTLGLRPN